MASRRRQTLQLDPVCRKKGKVSSKVRMSSHPANPLLGMMSSYHSDEEEEEEEGKTEPKDVPQIEEDEEDSKEEKKEPVKKRTQIDEQVADFLKMISTMEDDDPGPATPPHTSVSTVAPTTSDEAHKDGLEGEIHGVTDLDDATDDNSSVVWQACIDGNTGFTYYWNTKTNEVSWTLPEDIVPADADNKLSDTLTTTTTTTTTTTETTRLPVPTGSDTTDLNEVCAKGSNDDLNTVGNLDEGSNRRDELPDDTETAEVDTKDEQNVLTDADTEPQATSNVCSIAISGPTLPGEETSMDTSNPIVTEKEEIDDHVSQQTIEGGEVESEILRVDHQNNMNDQQEDDEGTLPEQSNDHFAPPATNSSGIVVYAESSEEESDIDDLLDRALIENTDETSHLPGRNPRLKKRISYKVNPFKPTVKRIKITSEISTEESLDLVHKEDDGEEELSLETKGDVEHNVAGSDVEKDRVEAACGEILKRLSLLGVSMEGLHELVLEMVRLETRILDWQKGFLPSDFIVTCLSNTVRLLANYEAQIPPPGWTYVWDSDFQQYYYFNAETKKSSWDYPVADRREGKGESPDVTPPPEETSVLRGVGSTSMRTATPPPGVDVNVDPPITCEEWQAPPPPPPPLEEGEVPPSPPSLPIVSNENSENEEEEEEEDAKPFIVAAQPQIYYGPTMPPPEEMNVEKVETPSESKESSPSTEENRKKPKKKVLKVKMQGKKGKAVSSLLQKWTAMHHS